MKKIAKCCVKKIIEEKAVNKKETHHIMFHKCSNLKKCFKSILNGKQITLVLNIYHLFIYYNVSKYYKPYLRNSLIVLERSNSFNGTFYTKLE